MMHVHASTAMAMAMAGYGSCGFVCMRLDLTGGRNTFQGDTTGTPMPQWGGATSRHDIETNPWMSGTNITSKGEWGVFV